MSTVCYCGNTACPVRSMDRDACLDSLRAALTESQADRARTSQAHADALVRLSEAEAHVAEWKKSFYDLLNGGTR